MAVTFDANHDGKFDNLDADDLTGLTDILIPYVPEGISVATSESVQSADNTVIQALDPENTLYQLSFP